jgi:ribosomal protein L37AE/L43A
MWWWPSWLPVGDSWWALVVQVLYTFVVCVAGLLIVDATVRGVRSKRQGYGFWSQYVTWYGRPSFVGGLSRLELDPPESSDLRTWFDGDELADCPKCGHTAALISDSGALYCPVCGVVSPSEAEWAPSTCPKCGNQAFPVTKSGALYCPACGEIVSRGGGRDSSPSSAWHGAP